MIRCCESVFIGLAKYGSFALNINIVAGTYRNTVIKEVATILATKNTKYLMNQFITDQSY
jgi:hypothetical protein